MRYRVEHYEKHSDIIGDDGLPGARIQTANHYDVAEAVLKLLQPKQPPSSETVRVRIAVSMSPLGDWIAIGNGSFAGDESVVREMQRDGLTAKHHHITFVEADVPKPVEPQTVEGTVTE